MSVLLVEVSDGLARLTLHRPERLNAFDAELGRAFRDAVLDVTARQDVGAILLAGAGPAFCAGGDVVSMATSDGAALTATAGIINEGLIALREAPIPVVAAAHGTTAGGGLGILLASDYAIVGADSRIGSLYADIGLTPDLSVSAQLARAVGERRALQLVLQRRLLTADEALAWGLVAEVVAPDAVAARAEDVARSWLDGAAGAYGQAKRLIRSQPDRTFAGQLAEEAATIGAAFETPDAQRLIAAFAARTTRR